MNDEIIRIKDIIDGLTSKISYIFKKPLDESFIAAILILRGNSFPNISGIDDEDLKTLKQFYEAFKKEKYNALEIRRAFNEAYLSSLREIENYTVNVSLELPLQFLNMITNTIVDSFSYSNINILNAYANIGNLPVLLKSNLKAEQKLYVTVNDEKELIIAETLRDFIGFDYPIQTDLPALNFRCDLIVSDPFLRQVEDILIFFEDYVPYLNQGGFLVSSFPTAFIRSRAFSDTILNHGLVLVGLIEYPSDIIEGIMASSIVILEKKNDNNKEFFHAEMASIKDIDKNIKVMDDCKEYIKKYLGE